MCILSNAHTHTNLCDGKNTAEEMILAALAAGFSALGFSGHSYTPFDPESCMSLQKTEQYISEITALKEKYASQIAIYLGLELDYYSQIDLSPYQYIIGSVHYLKDPQTGIYYSIDNTEEEFIAALDKMFKGEIMHMIEQYYRQVVAMAQRSSTTILGHFDLIKKLNHGNRFFLEDSNSYKKIALSALEEAVKTDCIFEINSGGVYRNYTKEPYPATFLLEKLQELQKPLLISSDCHTSDSVDFYFSEMKHKLADMGFKEITVLGENGFQKQPLLKKAN
ncbi:MAG: histidinol-phosphatase [Bacillota bacterium]|jgi:histidinol-phosphatase (PHP family)